jgi:hypothetical protein
MALSCVAQCHSAIRIIARQAKMIEPMRGTGKGHGASSFHPVERSQRQVRRRRLPVVDPAQSTPIVNIVSPSPRALSSSGAVEHDQGTSM